MYVASDLLNLDGELASLSLVIPFSNPIGRTQRGEGLPENLAGFKILTFNSNTFVVVHVILGTVLRLVGEWKSWVELRSFELKVFCVESHFEGGVGVIDFSLPLTIFTMCEMDPHDWPVGLCAGLVV